MRGTLKRVTSRMHQVDRRTIMNELHAEDFSATPNNMTNSTFVAGVRASSKRSGTLDGMVAMIVAPFF